MMTKGPSRKQVIVLISSNNNNIFMKNLAIHITNINKQLRNTKSKILVDYIQSDSLGILLSPTKYPNNQTVKSLTSISRTLVI